MRVRGARESESPSCPAKQLNIVVVSITPKRYVYAVARKAGPHAAVDALEGLHAGNLRPPSSVDALSGGLASPARGGDLSVSGGFRSGALGRSGGALASRGGGGESPAKARDLTAAAALPGSLDDALAAKGAVDGRFISSKKHASIGAHLRASFHTTVWFAGQGRLTFIVLL